MNEILFVVVKSMESGHLRDQFAPQRHDSIRRSLYVESLDERIVDRCAIIRKLLHYRHAAEIFAGLSVSALLHDDQASSATPRSQLLTVYFILRNGLGTELHARQWICPARIEAARDYDELGLVAVDSGNQDAFERQALRVLATAGR
jgi:hypothetical protein